MHQIDTGDKVDPQYLGASRTLYISLSEVSNAGTSEETVRTYSLPAATLDVDNSWIEYRHWGRFASGSGAELIRIRIGASNYVFDSNDAGMPSSGVSGSKWQLSGGIYRVNNTTVTGEAVLSMGGLAIPGVPQTAGTPTDITGLNLTTTAYDIDLRFDGSAAGKIICRGSWIKHHPIF